MKEEQALEVKMGVEKSTDVKQTKSSYPCSRRSFLMGIGGVTALALEAATKGSLVGSGGESDGLEMAGICPVRSQQRPNQAFQIRCQAALYQRNLPLPSHPNNGEERDYPYLANFSKGLPHNNLGEVAPVAYQALLRALSYNDTASFESIPLGGVRKLRNPQAGIAFDLEGPDSHHIAIQPAPRIDSPQNSSEMAELYWMAHARDVNFTDYASSSSIADACTDLSRFSDFRGPKQLGFVTPATIFRGDTPGDQSGPYLSQFLLKDIPYGSLTISQRQRTFIPNLDYMTDPDSWLSIQKGIKPQQLDAFDPTPRYIRNGRDLSPYVQIDALYEAHLNACLILMGMGAPLDPGNPYLSLTKTDAFGTFGDPHILSLVTEVASRALKTVWYQKWYVHRRLRPEAFGGRVHYKLTGAANYPIDSEILNSQAVQRAYTRYGTYLLPQAFPEGSPLHPAYGAGHATVAGACVTILKAWFDESFVIPDPVVPNADGTALIPYTGPDSLTVGGELNKVAANIAIGRNFAGIHWRTDYSESIKLGEAVAIGILQDQKNTYGEHFSGFSLTKFDGTTITI
jgi:hypothetical protein